MVSNFQRDFVIPEEYQGVRIDKVLAELESDVSRTQLSKWIQNGEVKINGGTVKPTFKVVGGEIVQIDGVFEEALDWSASEEIELDILHEDDDILIVNKPAGLVVHPGAATKEPTLANGLLAHRPDLASLPRAGIVHRLDKGTSGLLVVATSEAARQRLIEAIAQRDVTRIYLAIVEGQLAQQRVVNLPLGRSSRNRTLQTVRLDGRPAETTFTPMRRFHRHTLLKAQLKTGRTHQIRVHASRIGLPLVGDIQYGSKRVAPPTASDLLQKQLSQFPRPALHAHVLGLKHPITQLELDFSVPLPADMLALKQLLEEDSGED